MFSFTGSIFLMLIDVVAAALLIGLTIAALAVIIFVLSQFIKAMFFANKLNKINMENKIDDKSN